MLKKEDIKTGTLIWWRADRHFSFWDCPGVITEVRNHVSVDPKKRGEFKVQTFDTFEETDWLDIPDYDKLSEYGHDSCVTEMSVGKLREVKDYLKGRRRRLEDEIDEAKRSVEDAETDLVDFDKVVSTLTL